MRRDVRWLSATVLLLTTAAAGILPAPHAGASVQVTDQPDFKVELDDGTPIAVDCDAGNVRVFTQGVPFTFTTDCSAVTSLTVIATGSFRNFISVSTLRFLEFTSLAAVTIDGGPGRDKLIGSPLGDTIRGRAGNDELYGHEGEDVLNGGQGTDHCEGGSSDDIRRRCETGA